MSIQRNTDERPLDTFESALLGQLTAVVDERATQAAAFALAPTDQSTGPLVGHVAAAAAGTVALLVLPGRRHPPRMPWTRTPRAPSPSGSTSSPTRTPSRMLAAKASPRT